jgi:hypothetical protein
MIDCQCGYAFRYKRITGVTVIDSKLITLMIRFVDA